VYFLQPTSDQHVKIGTTARLAHRVRTIELVVHGDPVTILGVVEGDLLAVTNTTGLPPGREVTEWDGECVCLDVGAVHFGLERHHIQDRPDTAIFITG
jgi:hypothetical protein